MAETLVAPPKVKLTPAQRDTLVVAGAGLLRALAVGAYTAGRAAYLPEPKSPTMSARALWRMELIRRAPDTGLIVLTPEGKALFEEVVTPREREGIERLAQDIARAREWAEKNDRKRAWLDKTRDERIAWGDRSRDLHFESRTAKDRIHAIGWEIGRCANDVDGLLAELRTLVARHDELAQEIKDHDAARPRFEDGSYA